jgi:hypothetical protein
VTAQILSWALPLVVFAAVVIWFAAVVRQRNGKR